VSAVAEKSAHTGNVVVQAAVSRDGFISGPGHSTDWVFEYTMPDDMPEIIEATGAMLSGRTTYDVGVTFLSGDIATAVAAAKQAAGDKDLVLLGADVARQCLDRGLVDEIQLMILPVLLGDGVRLYGSDGAARVNLEPASSTQSDGVTFLRYRVAGQG
jgi:dihydrofolate reductase